MRLNFLACLALALIVFTTTSNADDRPNVVVMMVDDLGFSDLGCYGSEIETPNLDALAETGVRFSQFYNTAKCHSSRVSLLSGQYCIPAGDTALSHAVTSAEVLSAGGYFTAMTGKWHLKQNPLDFGFQHYFGHLSGACNYFRGDNSFRLGRAPWKIPDEGFYTTVANVDFAIEFLAEARKTEQPWYLYVAFNAPHAPLHALQEDYDKYAGRYDRGWDLIREKRVAKQKALGLLANDFQESVRPEHIPAWNDLEPWRQAYEANRMQTLAAMIDRVDQEVGRLVEDLRTAGELDNTVILFVSDNGACPYDRSPVKLNVTPTSGGVSLGDSTGWAWARNSPFRFYKQNQFEGGIATPAIVHWPAGLKIPGGEIIREPAHLIDVMPTLAEITECEIPDTYPGRTLRPVSGVSLMPVFAGKPLKRNNPIHFQFQNDRGLRKGDWKVVSFRGQTWELYDMANDRAETKDLAEQQPSRLNELVQEWNEMAEQVLFLPEKLSGPAKEAVLPHRHPEWTNFEISDPNDLSAARRRRNTRSLNGPVKPRARKDTKLEIVGDRIELTFTGPDPGMVFDWRGRELGAGPYQLSFRYRGDSSSAELFYTLNDRSPPLKGKRLSFSLNDDADKWQDVNLVIPVNERIYQLRIDPTTAVGSATIIDMTLSDGKGEVVGQWPVTQERH